MRQCEIIIGILYKMTLDNNIHCHNQRKGGSMSTPTEQGVGNMGADATKAVGAATQGEGGYDSEFYSSGIIFSKSTNLGVDSKGKEKLSMLLDEAATEALIEAVNHVKSLGKRIKLQVHYTEDNSFLFVKEVQPKGAGFTKAKTGGARPGAASADIKSKIANMKRPS